KLEVDEMLVIPDEDAPLNKAIAPWTSSPNARYFDKLVTALCKELDVDPKTPWSELTKAEQKAGLKGHPTPISVRYNNRYGRQRDQTDSDWAKERYRSYMREVACPTCKGARLKPEVLAVTIASGEKELSIAGVSDLSIAEASEFLDNLTLNKRQEMIAGAVLRETQARLKFLLDVGLDCLALSRSAGTLSGGEAQRIRLATQIGAGLAGVLYVLDEPSIGLHQRDNARLITTLEDLRDLGNTLIVVEHDEDTIRA